VAIRSVTPISVAYPEPNDGNHTRYLSFCRIEDDEGVVGWGEAITMWPAACRATDAMVAGLGETLIGRDPRDNVQLWRELREQTWWHGPQGAAAFARSAIDIALWDLRGKLTDQSLVAMLGGAAHASLPVIAATHPVDASLEVEVERHARYVREGFAGIKAGYGKRGDARLGYALDRDVAFVHELREAVGPGPLIMVDRDHGLPWDYDYVSRFLRAVEPDDLYWIEEPFEPGDVASFRRLRAQSGVLIAGAEREWEDVGYRRVLAQETHDVIGIDPGRAEGITGFLRAAALADLAGVRVNAHAFSSAIITAASLGVSLATPAVRSFELKPEAGPMQEGLVTEPFAHVDGRISGRTGPGLGIEVVESTLEQHRLA
jgi:L-alanine-DL-glutamate epimerase-like enolase superfamily enzyme